jgi:hypothetical protein
MQDAAATALDRACRCLSVEPSAEPSDHGAPFRTVACCFSDGVVISLPFLIAGERQQVSKSRRPGGGSETANVPKIQCGMHPPKLSQSRRWEIPLSGTGRSGPIVTEAIKDRDALGSDPPTCANTMSRQPPRYHEQPPTPCAAALVPACPDTSALPNLQGQLFLSTDKSRVTTPTASHQDTASISTFCGLQLGNMIRHIPQEPLPP